MTLQTVQVLLHCLDKVTTADNDNAITYWDTGGQKLRFLTLSTRRPWTSISRGKSPWGTENMPSAGRNTLLDGLWRKQFPLQFLSECWLNNDQGVGVVSQAAAIAGSMTTARLNLCQMPQKTSSLWLLWGKTSSLQTIPAAGAPAPRACPLANASDGLGRRATEVGVLKDTLLNSCQIRCLHQKQTPTLKSLEDCPQSGHKIIQLLKVCTSSFIKELCDFLLQWHCWLTYKNILNSISWDFFSLKKKKIFS